MFEVNIQIPSAGEHMLGAPGDVCAILRRVIRFAQPAVNETGGDNFGYN